MKTFVEILEEKKKKKSNSNISNKEINWVMFNNIKENLVFINKENFDITKLSHDDILTFNKYLMAMNGVSTKVAELGHKGLNESLSENSLNENVDAKIVLLSTLIADDPDPSDIIKKMISQVGSPKEAEKQIDLMIPWLKKMKIASAVKLVKLSKAQNLLRSMA